MEQWSKWVEFLHIFLCNDPSAAEIYTLSLLGALPISPLLAPPLSSLQPSPRSTPLLPTWGGAGYAAGAALWGFPGCGCPRRMLWKPGCPAGTPAPARHPEHSSCCSGTHPHLGRTPELPPTHTMNTHTHTQTCQNTIRIYTHSYTNNMNIHTQHLIYLSSNIQKYKWDLEIKQKRCLKVKQNEHFGDMKLWHW